MKPSVYIETTIPSYLTGWPSSNLLHAAHQLSTRIWWSQRSAFDLYVSSVVIDECSQGDPEAAAARLTALADIPRVALTTEMFQLADRLMREVPLPTKAATDALHIAIAAVAQIHYLLTWNCTHIANPAFTRAVDRICRAAELQPPTIVTPMVFIDLEQPNDEE